MSNELFDFDPQKMKTPESAIMVNVLQSQMRVVIQQRSRLLSISNQRELTAQEKKWLVELNQQKQELIDKAQDSGLLRNSLK